MSSYLSMFEIIENEGDEFVAMRQVRGVCASVERTPEGYVPSVSDTEYGESCAKGQALRTPELAAESALSLARAHLDAMARAFAPFPAHRAETTEVAA